ncbi:HD domain-containing protein [Crassaminicella thermophila]|uniref:HD domain-containing protein n=1 Tax=Crassaminicella thermophila TaxID=2599308 RepID=A0A5C0SB22_CRATE|nr:HD domain-containing phosphohydrolase [Crassaminicella thermophila]QEK11250.1 HD domain-containing protein [Crassaminicella thermophila]
MQFNLNNFLFSLSYALDFVEMDILGVASNHSKRVAYIAYKLGGVLGLNQEELFDLVSLSILHDNGASQKVLHDKLQNRGKDKKKALESIKEHCIIGEKNIYKFPFFTDVKDVIKYHHETYAGMGFFGLDGKEIPLMSQIIFLGDTIENKFNVKGASIQERNVINTFIRENNKILFSPSISEAFMEISKHSSFWLDLKDEFINNALDEMVPKYYKELTWEEVRKITSIFSNIIDAKSQFTQKHSKELAEKIALMADYYKKNNEEKMKLMIAADLHDVGKLAISNAIIDKPGRLTKEEMNIIQEHAYYTRVSLQQIDEFEDIAKWASNHHEKLDGSGYPYGLKGKELDFNSRLMTCLDIYQALTEKRPYREGLTHSESMKVLRNMAKDGLIDGNIVEDIDKVFH